MSPEQFTLTRERSRGPDRKLLLYSRLPAAPAEPVWGGVFLFIGLQQLEQRPVRFNVEIPAGEVEYDGKLKQSSTLRAEGTAALLNRSLGEIRVQGTLSVTMQATCDRCLEPADFPVENRFDLLYMPAETSKDGGEEIDQAGIEVGYYQGSGLALNDVLREVVLLALPMQLVCSEACRGICPVCGHNRNQRDCGCHAEAADDRWSKLRTLRAEVGPHN
jgi:uncharacterized protein